MKNPKAGIVDRELDKQIVFASCANEQRARKHTSKANGVSH